MFYPSFNRFLFAVILTGITIYANAAIRLPSLIANNMVLQQNTKAALWGWADAGEKITITTSWNNKTVNVTADANGLLM